MWESAFATAAAPDSLEVLVGVDDDDPALWAYQGRLASLRGRTVRLFTQQTPTTVGRIWNNLWKQTGASVLMLGNDDLVFKGIGWDRRVCEAFDAWEDGLGVVWCEDGINGEKHAAFPFVSSLWCRTLGQLVPECFRFFYHDTWLYDLAHRIGRLKFLPDVVIEHCHWTRDGVHDETTRRNRSDGQSVSDRKTWVDTVVDRDKAAKVLREVMLCPK